MKLHSIESTAMSGASFSGAATSSEKSKARRDVLLGTIAVALHGSSEHSVSWSHPFGDSQSHGCTSSPDVQSNGTEYTQQAENSVMVRPIPDRSLSYCSKPVNAHGARV